jgi:UDP-N-acetylglucosamine 2-epimerase (non-hydrolysing)
MTSTLKKINALVLFGTRPEAIKMAPIVKKFEELQEKIRTIVCVTGQHRQMLDQILDTFGISPHIDLDLMQENQSLASLSSRTMTALDAVLDKTQPDVMLVQGDTTTAMIGALAAHYHQIPVGHIEAGLRTDHRYDPFPEEMNRRLISVLSQYHFAPTRESETSLLNEGHPRESIFMTGNTVVDALLWVLDNRKSSVTDFFTDGKRGILVTAHRRENFQGPLRNICNALIKISQKFDDVEILYPVHLNPNINKPVHDLLSGVPGIRLVEPLPYEDLVQAMSQAYLIMTDSGGIQEEAPALGKPVLVMRETTERPEGVEAGVSKIVGTGEKSITDNANLLLTDDKAYEKMARAVNPYGDGQAADKIAHALLNCGRLDPV